MGGRWGDFLFTSCSYICITFPIIHIIPENGTFITIYDLCWHITVTEPEVYLKVPSWWYLVYGYGQMYGDIYSSLYYHMWYFHCSKIFCAMPVHFSPCNNHRSFFIVSIDLSFLRCHVVEIINYVAFWDWLCLLSNIHFILLHVFCGLIMHFFLVLSNFSFSAWYCDLLIHSCTDWHLGCF